MKEQVFPNLRRPSAIIMDNAPYHREFKDGEFIPSKAKKD